MAVFRIRKRSSGGFTVVGTLGDGHSLSAREVRVVADLEQASKAVREIAEGFERVRPSSKGTAS